MKLLPLWAAELFHPKLVSSFLHWEPKECLWTGGVCRYECLRHACLGRNLSPWLYSDLLLAFVSSEYNHGANHSLTFKFSLLINSQPGGKQYLFLALTGSSNCALGISVSCCPSEESGLTDIAQHWPRHAWQENGTHVSPKTHPVTSPHLT